VLVECKAGQHAELIIVEGKHAANAVDLVRDKNTQAILAMQGKVPNIAKSGSRRQRQSSDHIRLLTDALASAAAHSDPTERRFDRVLILSDPDMDGLHAALLLICLVAETYPQLVRDERLLWCRSPQYKIHSDGTGQERYAYSELELQHYRAKVDGSAQVQHFKGIASIPADLLSRACIDPASRVARVVSVADCIALKKQLEQPFKTGSM
jgi:DNA gyrase/topoisomerase IV subunit B